MTRPPRATTERVTVHDAGDRVLSVAAYVDAVREVVGRWGAATLVDPDPRPKPQPQPNIVNSKGERRRKDQQA